MKNITCGEIAFIDNSNLEAVHNYKELLNKIKEYILLVDEYVDKENFLFEIESHGGTCYLFKRAIMDYAKEGFNCIVTGSFYAVNMINRAIIENYVCYYQISLHDDLELWKYYRIHSYFIAMKPYDDITNQVKDKFNKLLESYEIDKTIIEKKAFKTGYGWTLPLGKSFNFRELCELVNLDLYNDYKYLCQYSHGVSILQKQCTFAFYDTIIPMYFRFYYYIQSLFLHSYYDGTDEKERQLREAINRLVQRNLEDLKEDSFF